MTHFDVQTVGRSLQDGLNALGAIGCDEASGGYNRFAWTVEDQAARAWFCGEAARLGLEVEVDRNSNLWAWWRCGDGKAIATGSHLDTVPQGGNLDGALGVVSGFCAVELLQNCRVTPTRPIAVVMFCDEEGARFNTPTFGSRLMVGKVVIDDVAQRRDRDGISLTEAVTSAGFEFSKFGRDEVQLDSLGCFLELHVEQGRALALRDVAVGLGQGIWPHGRWRVELSGEANHAGTTLLVDRRDPTLVVAQAISGARQLAEELELLATVGKLEVWPGGTNIVADKAVLWLDARAATDAALDKFLGAWEEQLSIASKEHGVEHQMVCESRTDRVDFDSELTAGLSAVLSARFGTVPVIPTGAGHDAGVLAAEIPTAMLFVRNETGMSHSPHEDANPADCLAGVEALALCLSDLAGGLA